MLQHKPWHNVCKTSTYVKRAVFVEWQKLSFNTSPQINLDDSITKIVHRSTSSSHLGGVPLIMKTNATCLGVKIDNKLSWKDDILSTTKQQNNKKWGSPETLKSIYLQGILPSVTYALPVWEMDVKINWITWMIVTVELREWFFELVIKFLWCVETW